MRALHPRPRHSLKKAHSGTRPEEEGEERQVSHATHEVVEEEKVERRKGVEY
jgi:hypothetical protein